MTAYCSRYCQHEHLEAVGLKSETKAGEEAGVLLAYIDVITHGGLSELHVSACVPSYKVSRKKIH